MALWQQWGEPNSHGTPTPPPHAPRAARQQLASRLIGWGVYFLPCFKERRDQGDLNKVGEQRLGDLRAVQVRCR
jgi:hypothetical protein